MTLTFCVIHRYSRRTLCPEVTVSRAVHQAIKKVKSMPRLSVLSEKPTNRDCANKKIPLVVTYHPSLPPIRQITSANHHILHTSESPPTCHPRGAYDCFQTALLAWGTSSSEPRSRPLMTVPFLPSSMECLGALLDVFTCQEHILESDSFKSHTTGAHHKIRGHITCTTF